MSLGAWLTAGNGHIIIKENMGVKGDRYESFKFWIAEH